LQRRLQWRGLSMVILPTRVDLERGRAAAIQEAPSAAGVSGDGKNAKQGP
jgi:hypothetical protein